MSSQYKMVEKEAQDAMLSRCNNITMSSIVYYGS